MQGQVKLGPENYESTPQITYIYEIKTSVQKKEQMCPGLSNSDFYLGMYLTDLTLIEEVEILRWIY